MSNARRVAGGEASHSSYECKLEAGREVHVLAPVLVRTICVHSDLIANFAARACRTLVTVSYRLGKRLTLAGAGVAGV